MSKWSRNTWSIRTKTTSTDCARDCDLLKLPCSAAHFAFKPIFANDPVAQKSNAHFESSQNRPNRLL